MNCPVCIETKTDVHDSRTIANNHAVRRRRVCPTCKLRFTTYEISKETYDSVVRFNKFRAIYKSFLDDSLADELKL